MSSSCLNSLISHTRLAGRWWVSKSHQARVVVVMAVGNEDRMHYMRKSISPKYNGVWKKSKHIAKEGSLGAFQKAYQLSLYYICRVLAFS